MGLSPFNSERALLSSPVERRVCARFAWKGTVCIRILPSGPDVLGVLLDLSEGGCGVELGVLIPAQVGAKVELELFLHGLTLKRTGIIRRIELIRRSEKETRAGIEFIEEKGRGAEEFRRLLRELHRRAGKDGLPSAMDTPAQRWWTRLSR